MSQFFHKSHFPFSFFHLSSWKITKNGKLFLTIFCLFTTLSINAQHVIDMGKYGIKPSKQADNAGKMVRALERIKTEFKTNETIILSFPKGEYHFYPQKAAEKTYYVSNHDQPNPKKVGLALEHLQNVIIEGNGSSFIFHGRIMPLSLVKSKNCELRNFSIDFADPTISQVEIMENKGDEGIIFKVQDGVKHDIKSGKFNTHGSGWTLTPFVGLAFEPKTKHVVYNTSDVLFNSDGIKQIAPNTYHAPHFKHKALVPGTIFALHTSDRPAPGIFLAENENTTVKNVKVHFADGMGLLAQLCNNITLDGFSVCLKGEGDPRYFTTQADATHFSQCRGKISSCNALYEGMMDDAINVHGVYLKLTRRINDKTVIADFMHYQAYGFDWGYPGDSVQFVSSKTMDSVFVSTIAHIRHIGDNNGKGMKQFEIAFTDRLPDWDLQQQSIGIENTTWTPEIYFANNIIRNNRARGSLFSSMRKTVVENNLFDHTSGTAILLCGDCNGWYESGSCKDILIQNNTFVNALTNMFQFTNAVISIFPVIPELENQRTYYHGGSKDAIRIINNTFKTFDKPILYAKSVDGILFQNNVIEQNNDYLPLHWNKSRFLLERVNRIRIE